MVFWIKRTARILGIVTFFVVFFIGLDPEQLFDPQILSIALFKGILGAALFWFAGFVLGDIVFKGLVTGIETTQADAIEGGLIQRIHDEKIREHPDTMAANTDQPEKQTKKKTQKDI
jgi:hypothetical protein